MPSNTQNISARLMVVCAKVVKPEEDKDKTDPKWTIQKPYHTVWMPPGIDSGFLVKKLHVYFQVTDGSGRYSLGLTVEMVDYSKKRDMLLYRSGPYAIELTSPLDVYEGRFVLKNVPFPRPELYCLSTIENGVVLPGGSAELSVRSGVET